MRIGMLCDICIYMWYTKSCQETWHGPFSVEAEGEKPSDESEVGRQYFVNSNSNASSWEDPRVDAQVIYELQSMLVEKVNEVFSVSFRPPIFSLSSLF